MKLKYDAASYIMEKEEPHPKARVLMALNEKDEDFKGLLNELKESQSLDGGWPWLGRWPFNEPRPSSIYDTACVLDLLLKAGEDGVMVKEAPL